jgi:hypothetical protein
MDSKDGLQEIAGMFQPRHTKPTIVHTRQLEKVKTLDIDKEPMKYVALALVHLRNSMNDMAQMIGDESKPVDEYNVQSLAPEVQGASFTIEVLPQYETPEIIKSIVIVGPAAATGTLQMGDRVWNFVVPATGILPVSPVAVCLNRSDRRILTAVSGTGEWSLELMGHADQRGNLI